MAGRPKGIPKTGGRVKGEPNQANRSLKAYAQQYTEEAVNVWVSIMRDTTAPHAARVSAAGYVVDRGHGKPPLAVTGEDGGPIDIISRVIHQHDA